MGVHSAIGSRRKPTGWRYESTRHSLAARGYCTTKPSEAKILTLYHGTQKKFVPKIMEEGLRPQKRKQRGPSGLYTSDAPVLYVTPSRSAAILHATVGPEVEHQKLAHIAAQEGLRSEEPVVLELRVPVKRLGELDKEMLREGIFDDTGLMSTYEFELRGANAIPPEDIRVMDVDEAKRKELRRSALPHRVGAGYTTPSRHGKTHEWEEELPEWFAKKVDLKRYAGTWKQQSVKNEPWFQKGCKKVTAKYTLQKDGTVKVVNTCDGRKVEGVARSVSKDNRRLKVRFGIFPEGDYVIKSLNPSYTRAVVKGGKTEWVLIR